MTVSNIPQLENALSQAGLNLFGDPFLVGSFLVLSLILLWSFVGGGLELAIVIFIPALLLFFSYGLVPSWISLLISIALALAVVFLFRGFGQR